MVLFSLYHSGGLVELVKSTLPISTVPLEEGGRCGNGISPCCSPFDVNLDHTTSLSPKTSLESCTAHFLAEILFFAFGGGVC